MSKPKSNRCPPALVGFHYSCCAFLYDKFYDLMTFLLNEMTEATPIFNDKPPVVKLHTLIIRLTSLSTFTTSNAMASSSVAATSINSAGPFHI